MDKFSDDFNASRSEAALSTIDFRGDLLYAVRRDGHVFVAIKPICLALGLDWSWQFQRVKRDAILSEGMVVTPIPSAGGVQDTACLRLDLVNGWLFGIEERRVKDEATRQKVLAYKRECYGVLFRHFYAKAEGAVTGEGYGSRSTVDADIDAEIDLASLPDRTVKIWIDMAREARMIAGRAAGVSIWRRSPLPPLPFSAYLEDQSPQLKAFLEACTSPAPGESVPAARLYAAYQDWCLRNRIRAGTPTWFGRHVPLQKMRSHWVHYLDIRLREAAEAL